MNNNPRHSTSVLPLIAAGVQVRILPGNENEVRCRHPNLVGKIGVIESIPTAAGGGDFYTVKINISTSSSAAKAQIVKLKPDAFVVLGAEKQQNVATSNAASTVTATATKSKLDKSATQNRPRSNSSPGAATAAFSALKPGSKVEIIGTETVMQRLPQIVGKIGIIKEAPVHPATWFKVEFLPEHRVLTFRPSALRPVDDDGKPLFLHSTHNYSSSNSSSNNNSSSSSNSNSLSKPVQKQQQQQQQLLQAKVAKGVAEKNKPVKDDPDTWIGRYVSILSGRGAGQQAKVVSYGNGWVQLASSYHSSGEDMKETIPKRAYELQLLLDSQPADASSITNVAATQLGDNGDEQEADNRRTAKRQRIGRNHAAPASVNRNSSDTTATAVADSSAAFDFNYSTGAGVNFASEGTTSSTAAFLRSLRTALDGSEPSLPQPPMAPTSSRHTAAAAMVGHKRVRAYSDSLMNPSPTAGVGGAFSFQMFTSATADMLPPSQMFRSALQEHQQRQRLNHPIVSSASIDAKKNFISKYVSRHVAKISSRPHLVDWRQQFDVSLCHDRHFESQAARLFDESYCEVCNLEKWPNAKFCWNESCPVSPVYFKLTGACVQEIVEEDDLTASNTAINAIPADIDKSLLSSTTSSSAAISLDSNKVVHFSATEASATPVLAQPHPQLYHYNSSNNNNSGSSGSSSNNGHSANAFIPPSLLPQRNVVSDFLLNFPQQIVGGAEPAGTAPDFSHQSQSARSSRNNNGTTISAAITATAAGKDRKSPTTGPKNKSPSAASSSSAATAATTSSAVLKETSLPLHRCGAEPEMMGLAPSRRDNNIAVMTPSQYSSLISPSITSASDVISRFAFATDRMDSTQAEAVSKAPSSSDTSFYSTAVTTSKRAPPFPATATSQSASVPATTVTAAPLVYTQYYYKDDRSDSLGETDCENRSPPTVTLKDPAIAAGFSGTTLSDDEVMSELALPRAASSIGSMDALATAVHKSSPMPLPPPSRVPITDHRSVK